jgi:5,10-methylenetetrahydromethanopterin reductase
VPDPRPALAQARDAEALGLHAVWIGERYDTKDLPALAGALSQVTTRVQIGAAVTHPGLRHPMVLASMGQTLQALSEGRFVLGLGRSAPWRWQAYGSPAPTTESLCDTADILRRLWAGETVTYRGPAGTFPALRLPQRPTIAPPPLLLAAVGPRTLAAAGRVFDGVICHPFLTPSAVGDAVAAVRAAASAAGRDPTAVRCVAIVVVAAPDDADLIVGARAAGYFSVAGLGEVLVEANGWSRSDLDRYRAAPELQALDGRTADKALSRSALAALARRLPETWLASSSVVGEPEACAAGLQEYLDAGADELIVHGTTAGRLAELVGIAR